MATRRSGTQWTEAQFAERGYVQVKFRLRQEDAAELDALAKQWGCSRVEAHRRAVREARKTRGKRGSKKST